MYGTKAVLTAITWAIFVIAFSSQAGSEEPKGKSQSYEYMGIIKARGEGTHILKVQTQGGPMNFHYQRHGKKECAGFRELAVGDSVKVTAADNKPVSEATCIIKAKLDPAAK
jgi:hypothetical protein